MRHGGYDLRSWPSKPAAAADGSAKGESLECSAAASSQSPKAQNQILPTIMQILHDISANN
jgi:hypothetical protein